jgi:BMFP domain-containing protein YqiC
MSKNSDFLATLKTFTSKLSEGEKSPSEMATAFNAWLKDGGEALKIKIEDEVERSVSKMGFIKRGEFEALKQEVASLKSGSAKKAAEKKIPAKKAAAKKTAPTKASAKKIVKKSAKKVSAKKVAK